MNVVITGASGFVGQNLSQFLVENGYAVSALSLREKSFALPPDADALIHLAGKAHDTQNTASAQDYFEVNFKLTAALFDDFLKTEIRDFFFFSSVKAAADTVEGILDELHTANPATPYGKSKLEAERYLLGKNLPVGKRLFIIRPCMIHGPGNKGNLNLLYQVVQKGLPWPLAAFQNNRSFLSIENLNFLINEMLQNTSVLSGIYNFSDDEPLSTNQLVQIIAATSGKKPKFWKLSPALLTFASKIGDRLYLPLNTERLRKLTENYRVSNAKIKSALGIDELPVSAEKGLQKTIKSFKE